MVDGPQMEGDAAALAARVAVLEAENAELRAVVAFLEARIVELEARLRRNPRNSSMPPSAEGLSKPPAPGRRKKKGKRRPGKQPGDPGTHLAQVADPDEVVHHLPPSCGGCGADLGAAEVVGEEVRQVFDLPAVRAFVREHRVERRRCGCGHESAGVFPREARAPACYGAGIRALACYLVVAQHLPYTRAAAVLAEVAGVPVSVGAVAAMVAEGGDALGGFAEAIVEDLRLSPVVHFDETGARVAGHTIWVHTASTEGLTAYLVHERRGRGAIDDMGVIEHLSGVAVHDGFAPYRTYEVTHALCNAHHLRELEGVAEFPGQGWAEEMGTLLRSTYAKVERAKEAGEPSLSKRRLAFLHRRYDALVSAGYAANPPPVYTGKQGRPKRTKAANLVRRLDLYRDDVLRFAADFTIPFTNNLAERDLRMVKLQQKISGSFRSRAGANAYLALRSYVSTARKQGLGALTALHRLFEGDPFLPRAAGT